MTAPVLTPQQLPQLATGFLDTHHVVALTFATREDAWTCQTAWACARAVAASGRPVLLIDLSADGPGLDTRTTGATTRGIMDVFEGGGGLEDVAREQGAGLHYIGRGAAGEPGPAIWSHERWQRLARGFSNEGALLLLFVPPEALAMLPIPDLSLVILAAGGYDIETGSPAIRERVAQGAPVVGVIARSLVPSRPSGGQPLPRRRALTGLWGAAAILVVTLVVAWSRSSGTERREGSRLDRPVTLPGPATPPPDSLYYSVQVAAHNTLDEALRQAGDIEARGRLAVITPVRPGNQGTWYRVLVDALPTARAADSLLQLMWTDGTLERPQGSILRTPDTYRLRGWHGDVAALRARGIPAYIVLAPDSTEQVFVGAFDVAEQARLTDSLLAATGLTGTLVRRTGSPP